MIQYLCDACRTKLTPTDLAASAAATRDFLASNQARPGIVIEIFCPTHLPHAGGFWLAKLTETSEAIAALEGRLANFSNKYWAASRLQRVK